MNSSKDVVSIENKVGNFLLFTILYSILMGGIAAIIFPSLNTQMSSAIIYIIAVFITMLNIFNKTTISIEKMPKFKVIILILNLFLSNFGAVLLLFLGELDINYAIWGIITFVLSSLIILVRLNPNNVEAV